MKKKLNPAEILGLHTAQSQVQEAERVFAEKRQAFMDLQKAIGLDPTKQYQIAEDGTVEPLLELNSE